MSGILATGILAALGADPKGSWAPIMFLLIIAILFAITNVAASLIIGPSRTGPGKETTYESGMLPIGDTRQRFNVRFYIVAMVFLVFDVEIVFLYPWATIFSANVQPGVPNNIGGLLLGEMVVFVVILLVAYFYAWGKGVFRWD
jgi:NADH-quinone oxidoreductase subunit A